jgi:hypothetical protein
MIRLSAVTFTVAVLLLIPTSLGQVEIRFRPATNGLPGELKTFVGAVTH